MRGGTGAVKSDGLRTPEWAGRTPGENALLEQRDEELGGQRDDGHDRHAGEDGVRVEPALRLADDKADTALGAKDLADQRTDDGEAEGGVQAGDDPGQRGRDGDVAGDLERRGPSTLTLATRFGSTSRTPWKALKKTMKNTRTAASRTLGNVPRPKATRKIEPRMMRGIGVHDLDVRAENIGEEAVLTEQETDEDTGRRRRGRTRTPPPSR